MRVLVFLGSFLTVGMLTVAVMEPTKDYASLLMLVGSLGAAHLAVIFYDRRNDG